MSEDQEKRLHDGELPHTSIDLKGPLVLSGHRVGVQVGAHEVVFLDDRLRGLVGKEIRIAVEEKK